MPATVMLGPPVMVSPLVSIFVLPVVTLPSPVRSMFLASLTSSVSVPLATTPMLPLVSWVPSLCPPVTLTVSPS